MASSTGYWSATGSATMTNSRGGARHTRDEKEFVYTQYIAADLAGNPLPFFPGAVTETGEFKPGLAPIVGNGSGTVDDAFRETTFKFGIDAQLPNDTLLYYSFSQGFKSGGFVLRYVEAVPRPRTFEPELLDTHEIGLKWRGFDDRVRLNAAAFLSDYQEVQVTFFDRLGGPVTANAGTVDILGLEIELTALLAAGLRLDLGYGYLDADYDEINPVAGLSLTIDESAKLVNAPAHSLSAGVEYAMYSMHEQVHIAAWPAFSCYPEAYSLGPRANNAISQVYAGALAPCATERGTFIDQASVANHLYVCYWRKSNYDRWWAASAPWWRDSKRIADGVGLWREAFVMPFDRLEGMRYLRDNPRETRCYSLRFVDSRDGAWGTVDRSFGLGFATDVHAFEKWAKSHPTHLAIFDGFLRMVETFGTDLRLRLWHEVTALPRDGCEFEYIGCHPHTGLLRYVRGPDEQ